MGPYKPLRTWVAEFIPYYMEIRGVDRPWHMCKNKETTYNNQLKTFFLKQEYTTDNWNH